MSEIGAQNIGEKAWQITYNVIVRLTAWMETLNWMLRRLIRGKYMVAVREDASVRYPRRYVR